MKEVEMWHWGWNWWMGIGMVVFWGVVCVGIWLAVRRVVPSKRPEDILAERFARGDVSAEEYEQSRRILTGR